jgi:hypothetical protein
LRDFSFRPRHPSAVTASDGVTPVAPQRWPLPALSTGGVLLALSFTLRLGMDYIIEVVSNLAILVNLACGLVPNLDASNSNRRSKIPE